MIQPRSHRGGLLSLRARRHSWGPRRLRVLLSLCRASLWMAGRLVKAALVKLTASLCIREAGADELGRFSHQSLATLVDRGVPDVIAITRVRPSANFRATVTNLTPHHVSPVWRGHMWIALGDVHYYSNRVCQFSYLAPRRPG